MDWDKLRIFHAVAEAGSFTHAGSTLNLSQSAVSRQISTLEEDLGVSLFHRHARGLLLTEQGEILQKAAKDIFGKLAMIEGQISDSKQLPEGPLRITTTEFIGSTWLAPHLKSFCDQNPHIRLRLFFDDRIYNLNMREADAAIRLYKPEQPELIQRQLATIHVNLYASSEYIEKYNMPETVGDLGKHCIISYPENTSSPFPDADWLVQSAGMEVRQNGKNILMNSITAIYQAVKNGIGIAALPDYLATDDSNLVKLSLDVAPKTVGMYFVYPEERRHSQRIAIFRDFLLDLVENTNF